MGYQQIDIDGFLKEGVDRMDDYKQMFDDPKDLTILDIGCNNGFYILKAISEGAEYAIGIDRNDTYLNVGREAKKYLKYNNIDFKKMDVFKNGLPDGDFDIVLCLNILHYFTIDKIKDLLWLLDKKCKKMMVFEVLNCYNGDWKYDKIKTGKERTFLSVNFFKNAFSKYKIESMSSKVTENRTIIKVYKGGK